MLTGSTVWVQLPVLVCIFQYFFCVLLGRIRIKAFKLLSEAYYNLEIPFTLALVKEGATVSLLAFECHVITKFTELG